MANKYLQHNTESTECLISAPYGFVPNVIECIGPLSSQVKPTLSNLGVLMGQTMTLDQHVNTLVHSCPKTSVEHDHSCIYFLAT